MAAKRITPSTTSLWWEKAYTFNEDIDVQYELQWKKDLIRPGNPIKIKNQRGVLKFRCIAHNIVLDITWIDCMDQNGQFHSFPIEDFRCLVKPKKSRRKR